MSTVAADRIVADPLAGCLEPRRPVRASASKSLGKFGRFVATFRNIVEVWPEEVYENSIIESRLLGRPVTYVVDPEFIRRLFTDEAHKLVRDETMIRSLKPALGAGLLTSDGPAWQAQRRSTAPSFRPERIRVFIPDMVNAAGAARRRLQAHGRGVVDLQAEMMRTALDVITSTIVSGEEGFDPKEFSAALNTYLGQTNWKIAYGILGVPRWLPHPHSIVGAQAARTLRSMTAHVIAQRRRRGTQGEDLLGMMLASSDPETGDALSDERLIDNLLTFVMAGHETTALAIAWSLRLLAEHPAIEKRVLEEIASAPAKLDTPGALEQLVYTRQVLMEAMRLYPPAALLVRRSAEELRFDDIVVPAGQSIHIPVYALHRHRRLWTDPDDFDPNRFAPDLQRLRHRFAFIPFGGGRRVCIGMGLAISECLVVLATLLPELRFKPLQPGLPQTHLRVTLRPVGGLPVIVEARGKA